MSASIDQTLFDQAAFDRSLAEDTPPLQLFRDAVRHATELLKEYFLAGRTATELVFARARFVDALLQRAWRQFLPDDADDIALLAVGGYGRGELHPHSDIDVMILLADETRRYNEQLEHFLRFLWDIGLEVGHSVRTLDECAVQAERDISITTNIQEARLLVGPPALHEEQRRRCAPDHLWPSKAFFQAKWREQDKRHEKFNDTAYNLEPNIKEGPGGLRDIQMIGWVAKRHFDADTLHDLVTHQFLTELEYDALIAGQSFLWKIRFGLHVLSGRREDRLLFDYQRSLAKQFGFRDEPHRLAVETFMKQYYRTVMELNRLNEMLLQLFQEEILYTDDSSEPTVINRRFQVRKGFLEVTRPEVFKRYPFALLELFLIMAYNPEIKGVRANTIRGIRDHRYLIDNDFRSDLRCISLFIEILRQPKGVTHELRRMNRYGVLAAYIPAFGRIVGQMQHDLFHVYTVDEHTLVLVRNLRRFTVPEFFHEFPLCSQIMQTIPKQELLLIAALFHDIAKGRGGDHSELGAVDAERFCRQHSLSQHDTQLVIWLVKNHLLMSSTSQRKDISDPGVVHQFANHVGDRVHLDYLYLLTVADIRATSPDVWNTWKDALLKELYNAARHALQRGLDNPLMQTEYIEDIKKTARHTLNQTNLSKKDIKKLWARWDSEYFLRYTAMEIVWHTKSILNAKQQVPLVLIRKASQRGGTEIFIYSKIFDELFAWTTSIIDQMGLTIVDARIMQSKDGYTLNTYIVLSQSGDPITEEYHLQELAEKISSSIRDTIPHAIDTNQRLNRRQKHFSFPAEVEFWRAPDADRTVMQVTAMDRPGLLSLVGSALNHHHVRLHNAKITTFGERAEDLFFITDEADQPIEDRQKLGGLRQTIIEFLND